jgi:lipoate---protein ligase
VIRIDIPAGLDPYTHAALEDYLVRHLDTTMSDYVILYTNAPCVVIGKNQSLYREVNIHHLRDPDAILVRRVSGGGTVYHDAGNLCFAFVSKHEDYKVNNYKYFNQVLVDILQAQGLDVYYSARNDLMLDGKKISGNAQFTNRKNILSHGTLLVNANMDKLRAALLVNDYEVLTRAVSSVRSPVLNLAQVAAHISTVEQLKAILVDKIPIKSVKVLTDHEWAMIHSLARDKYAHIDWIYGRNPSSQIVKHNMTVYTEGGRVTAITAGAEPILTHVVGAYYSHSGLIDAGLTTDEVAQLF